jgi:hypothetical protein
VLNCRHFAKSTMRSGREWNIHGTGLRCAIVEPATIVPPRNECEWERTGEGGIPIEPEGYPVRCPSGNGFCSSRKRQAIALPHQGGLRALPGAEGPASTPTVALRSCHGAWSSRNAGGWAV